MHQILIKETNFSHKGKELLGVSLLHLEVKREEKVVERKSIEVKATKASC